MTEREYIDATNLAKIRVAKNVLRDVLPMSADEEKWLRQAQIELRRIEAILEKAVRTEPELGQPQSTGRDGHADPS